ncbi:hypothetical protein L207DRAFT_163277 [Hyaloscypha variabilis F]|uniref:Mid2 domain-containing protein n=1 Tax=Hyaloscypha variabilis (strain UAMH 11265 / GT02V1 / F) TaxID=1149755 RepID=A0A2J6SAF4_HYAVF|nr:hypothetical protein L207DRAFT_163277 [Hyaloscypha variabilis F]
MSSTAATTTFGVPLPLTTTFTPAPSCFSTYVSNGTNTVFYLGPIGDLACYPSGWALNSTNYFSPGHCPSGYFGVTTSLNSINTLVETVVTCCPSDYEYVLSPFITNYYCTQGFDFTTVTALKVNDGTTAETVGSYVFGAVNAASVQVRWQSTDFQGSSASSMSTSSSSTSSSSSSSSSTSSQSGVKIGIGVGVPLGILLLLSMLIAFIFWRRTRQTRHPQSDQPTEHNLNDLSSAFIGVPKAELPAPAPTISQLTSEPNLPLATYGRLSNQDYVPVELDGSRNVH